MSNNPHLLTNDNDQGLEWAKTKNYAFFMESSTIEYLIERNCDVTQVGGLLDEKGYGIAMRKNSNYRKALSEGVLRLQERGTLTTLKTKWWKERTKGTVCSAKGGGGDAEELDMQNMFGVLIELIELIEHFKLYQKRPVLVFICSPLTLDEMEKKFKENFWIYENYKRV